MEIHFFLGTIGGIVGIISGSWALWDRYKDRIPRIKVFAPYQWIGNDAVTGKPIYAVFFRFSNTSKSSSYLFFETLNVEAFDEESQQWYKIIPLNLMNEKIQTDFSKEKQSRFGINKTKHLDIFGESFVKYGEPLCGYIFFGTKNRNYSRLKGEILDSRHKKVHFKIDFKEQKKYDPYSKKSS